MFHLVTRKRPQEPLLTNCVSKWLPTQIANQFNITLHAEVVVVVLVVAVAVVIVERVVEQTYNQLLVGSGNQLDSARPLIKHQQLSLD